MNDLFNGLKYVVQNRRKEKGAEWETVSAFANKETAYANESFDSDTCESRVVKVEDK